MTTNTLVYDYKYTCIGLQRIVYMTTNKRAYDYKDSCM